MEFNQALMYVYKNWQIGRESWSDGTTIRMQPFTETSSAFLYSTRVNGRWSPWTPTQDDIFATDWYATP